MNDTGKREPDIEPLKTWFRERAPAAPKQNEKISLDNGLSRGLSCPIGILAAGLALVSAMLCLLPTPGDENATSARKDLPLTVRVTHETKTLRKLDPNSPATAALAEPAALTKPTETSSSPGVATNAVPAPERPPVFDPSKVVLRNGKLFEHASVSRVEPDGLTIQYDPPGGGIGLAKLKFKELPDDWQQRYGYRPDQAAAYEAQQALAASRAVFPAIPATEPAEAGRTRMANISQLMDIASDYHNKHTYSKGDAFVCVDMACDVWNMVRTKGLNAKIMVGNVEKDTASLTDANHAWVVAEIAPEELLAIESTVGRVVQFNENPRYYQGKAFSNPKEFKEFYYGRGAFSRP